MKCLLFVLTDMPNKLFRLFDLAIWVVLFLSFPLGAQKLDSTSQIDVARIAQLPPYWLELGFGGIKNVSWLNFGLGIPVGEDWVVSTNYCTANRDPYHLVPQYTNRTNSRALSITLGRSKSSNRMQSIFSFGPAINWSKQYTYLLSGNKPATSLIGALFGGAAPINSSIEITRSLAIKIDWQVIFFGRKHGIGFHPFIVSDLDHIYGGYSIDLIFWDR